VDDVHRPHIWMAYELLYFRYVRGYERQAVANQLSISDRQFSRENRAAIELLAITIWESFNLNQATFNARSRGGQDGTEESLTPKAGEMSAHASMPPESLPVEKPAPWPGILYSALDIIGPLARKNAVNLPDEFDPAMPGATVPQYAMRHALLSLLGILIPANPGSTIRFIPTEEAARLRLMIEITPPGHCYQSALALETARSLLEYSGGQLDTISDSNTGRYCMTLPTLEQIPILVIDDNPDILQLFTRYTQGTRFAIIGVQDSRLAIEICQRTKPQIVVLDVMMPEVDGWELLGRLQHILAGQLSRFIVCSILPQAPIAQSLGADGFLQKPVLPQDFLALLDQLVAKNDADDL